MKFSDAPAMRKAEENLKRKLTEILEKLAVPQSPIACVHSHDDFEDNSGFYVWLDLVDESQVLISCCPGKPIQVATVVPGRRPPAQHFQAQPYLETDKPE